MADEEETRDEATAPEPELVPPDEFTGSVLIQLVDEDGNVKDERRGGGL